MKYFLIICCCFYANSFAQDHHEKKTLYYASIGYPLHDDVLIQKKIFLAEIGYQRELNRFLGVELSLLRSSANSIVDELYNSHEQILSFLNSSGYTLYSDPFGSINTYALGVKIHLSILNNKKHYLSISTGIGRYSSKSKTVQLSYAKINSITGKLIDFDLKYSEAIRTEGKFVNYSIQYYRYLKHNCFIGSKLQLLMDRNFYSYDEQPNYPDFWGLTLSIGKYL